MHLRIGGSGGIIAVPSIVGGDNSPGFPAKFKGKIGLESYSYCYCITL